MARAPPPGTTVAEATAATKVSGTRDDRTGTARTSPPTEGFSRDAGHRAAFAGPKIVGWPSAPPRRGALAPRAQELGNHSGCRRPSWALHRGSPLPPCLHKHLSSPRRAQVPPKVPCRLCEGAGEAGVVLQGLDLCLGEGVVVTGLGTAERAGHAEIGEEPPGSPAGQGVAAVSVQGEAHGLDALLEAGLLDEGPSSASLPSYTEGDRTTRAAWERGAPALGITRLRKAPASHGRLPARLSHRWGRIERNRRCPVRCSASPYAPSARCIKRHPRAMQRPNIWGREISWRSLRSRWHEAASPQATRHSGRDGNTT